MTTLRWFDWSKPLLPQVAAQLVDAFAAHGELDLGSALCVLPGRRGGRLLLELLVRQCADRKLRLVPPRVLTPGALADHLLHNCGKAIASTAEVEAAWMRTVLSADANERAVLFGRRLAADNLLAWRPLVATLQTVCNDLVTEGVAFTQITAQLEARELFEEVERWNIIVAWHEQVQRTLNDCGITDRAAAVRSLLRSNDAKQALQSNGSDRVLLISVPELSRLNRALLEALGDCVTAFIHAPESIAEGFDKHGCVECAFWSQRRIDVDDSQILVAADSEAQTQLMLRTLHGFGESYASDEITIGIGDDSHRAVLRQAAEWAGVRLHDSAGVRLAQTGPYRLLELIAGWIEDQRFSRLAALLRHPDLEDVVVASLEPWKRREPTLFDGVERAAAAVTDWLTVLDQYFTDHLHERDFSRWLGDRAHSMRRIYRAVERVLSELTPDGEATRVLGAWMPAVLRTLERIYARTDDDPEPRQQPITLRALEQLSERALELLRMIESLQPIVTSAEAIRLLLAHAAGDMLPDEVRADQIDMLGWLELHLDLSPALIITGVNDGNIPSTVAGDPLLPDSIRRSLSLACNETRFARDAYLLGAMLHSRESVTLIACRRTYEGEPETPSRLLLQCETVDLPARIGLLSSDAAPPQSIAPIGMPIPGAGGFEMPQLPDDLELPQQMAVTHFATYLKCPYRYALQHLLRLKARTDELCELEPMRFGTLAHEVLDEYAKDVDARELADAESIEQFLKHSLNSIMKRTYGRKLIPTLQIQRAQLRERLASFARKQAAMRHDGWRIIRSEQKFQTVSLVIPDQEPMVLHCRIDRIDLHPELGWRVIDFKSGDNASSPHAAHHKPKRFGKDGRIAQWLNLQLPLYDYVVRRASVGVAEGDSVELGFFVLPKETEQSRFLAAQWTAEHLASAIACAQDVVQRIRARQFDPSPNFKSGKYDSFARICRAGIRRVPREALPVAEVGA